MKTFKIIFKISLAFFVVLLFLSFFLFNRSGKIAKQYVGSYKVPMNKVKDGTYEGSFTVLGIIKGAHVRFEIKNNDIESFTFLSLLETPNFSVKEKILKAMKDKSTLHFDTITGATISSNLTKAAIKNALSKKVSTDKK